MDQAPAPSLSKELLSVPYIFNLLAIVLEVVPLLSVSFLPLKEVKKYFPIRSFVLSAFLNFALVWHILFAEEKVNDHLDSLYVTMMGMTLATVGAFMWMLHECVFGERPKLARAGMAGAVGALVFASGVILYAVQKKLHFSADKGWGLFFGGLAIIAALLLNGYPVIVASFSIKDVEPDIAAADVYGLCMTLLNTLDAYYFVAYAYCTGSYGSLLSWINLITTIFGVFHMWVFMRNLSTPMLKSVVRIFCAVVGLICLGMILWVVLTATLVE